jgi:cytochrome o ubiquinol oxidase subunit 3
MTTHALDHHDDQPNNKVIFGFWVYIMTDCILFASLFATYAVLRNNTYGGVSIIQVTHLPYVLMQSLLLITSGMTYGFSLIGMDKKSRGLILFWLGCTFLLGLGFLAIESCQFMQLIANGSTWKTSAFLSAYFSLVGIHGLHVAIGLVWIIILMMQLLMQNITPMMQTRLACLGLFWDFLNIIWVAIFTIVYLMGVI